MPKPAVVRYATMMDALIAQQLAVVVHIGDADVVPEMMHVYVIQLHKKYNVKLTFSRNHHQKIVDMRNLDKK